MFHVLQFLLPVRHREWLSRLLHMTSRSGLSRDPMTPTKGVLLVASRRDVTRVLHPIRLSGLIELLERAAKRISCERDERAPQWTCR